MGLGDDERGQSIQIGAIILFGALVIAMASYQAFVVPDQNQEIEFGHNQDVQGQLNDLRSTVVSMAGATTPRAATVGLGVNYPSRALFVNPGPASGSLRTAGMGNATVNVTVDNATAAGETGDFWNGSARAYDTGSLVYAPNYNLYDSAPKTVYSNTVLFNDFGDRTLAESQQALISDDRITVVTLNGSYSTATAGSVSVDFQPVSTAARTISVTNETGGNLTLRLTTRLNESEWQNLLDDEMVESGGNVVNVSTSPLPDRPDRRLRIELAGDRTYRLQMFKVGVGSRISGTQEAYLTDVDGKGTTVQKGGTTDIVLEVRDAYNNPKTGISVNASAAAGAFEDANNRTTSDADGRVTFTYNSSGVSAGTTQQLNFTLGDRRPGFNHSTPENVTVNVTVQAAGSTGTPPAYEISFDTTQMDGAEGVTCGPAGCTYNFADDKTDSAFPFVADTSPTVVAADVDFALNSTVRGIYSTENTTTDNSGNAVAVFDANRTGGVKSYVTSGRSDDTLSVSLIDTSKLISAFGSNTNDDSKYEFVRLYFAEPVNTTGWTLEDEEGTDQVTDLPSETLDGEIYLARNASAFANRWGIDETRVYSLSTKLNNNGEPLWLNDSSGNVVDHIGYGGQSPAGFSGSISSPATGQVAYRKFVGSTYPYQDTDSDSDWGFQSQTDLFGNADPSATFTYNPADPAAGEPITFDASGSSDPNGDSLTYAWDFGDGATGSGETVTHTYSSSGNYTVTLNVSDGNGGTDTTTQTVNVTEATAPFFNVTIDETNSPVNETEVLRVNATVENTGGSDDTQVVALTINGTQEDTATLTVSAGETASANLSWTTSSGDAGSYTAAVASENTTDSTAVTVEASSAADAVSLTTSSAGGGSGKVDFDLQNTGTSDVTIEKIAFNSTNSTAVKVLANGNSAELTQDGTDRLDETINKGGPAYTLDSPATISSGTTATFQFNRFQDGADDQVNMAGKRVTITLYFSDGSSNSLTLTP